MNRVAGLLLGRIGTELANASRAAQQNQIIQEKLQEVDNWLSERRFSKRMRTKIRSYYTEVGPRLLLYICTGLAGRSPSLGPLKRLRGGCQARRCSIRRVRGISALWDRVLCAECLATCTGVGQAVGAAGGRAHLHGAALRSAP